MERKILYRINLILCIGMIIRHAMYYYNWGIHEEFGTNQPLLGIVLIPITSIFGGLFLYKRKELKLNQYDLTKMALIGCLPFILNSQRLDETILYTITDTSRRPIFLILTPIAISGILKQFLPTRASILILSILYFYTNNFIVHYAIIFLLINEFSTRKISSIFIQLGNLLIGVPLFLLLSPSRINLLSEVILTLAALNIIDVLATRIKLSVPKISILYFYFVQALLFTILSKTMLNQFLSLTIILFLSLFFAHISSKLEDKLKLWLRL